MGVLNLTDAVKACADIYVAGIEHEIIISSRDNNYIKIEKNRNFCTLSLQYGPAPRNLEIRMESYTSKNKTEFINYIERHASKRYRIGKTSSKYDRSSLTSYVLRGNNRFNLVFDSVFSEEEFFQSSTVNDFGNVTFDDIALINEIDMHFRPLMPEFSELIIDTHVDDFLYDIDKVNRINRKIKSMIQTALVE